MFCSREFHPCPFTKENKYFMNVVQKICNDCHPAGSTRVVAYNSKYILFVFSIKMFLFSATVLPILFVKNKRDKRLPNLFSTENTPPRNRQLSTLYSPSYPLFCSPLDYHFFSTLSMIGVNINMR